MKINRTGSLPEWIMQLAQASKFDDDASKAFRQERNSSPFAEDVRDGLGMNKNIVVMGRSGSGEAVYFCSDLTQGERMVPNAQSIAYGFGSEAEAQTKMQQLQQKYKGITDWATERKL